MSTINIIRDMNDLPSKVYTAGPIEAAPQVMPAARAAFEVRKIRNGYVLSHSTEWGVAHQEDFCETLEDVGKRVTAIMVEHELKK